MPERDRGCVYAGSGEKVHIIQSPRQTIRPLSDYAPVDGILFLGRYRDLSHREKTALLSRIRRLIALH